MIAARLREETAKEHEELEKTMMPLLRAAVNTDGYGRLLRLMYSYLGAVESAVTETLTTDLLPDLPERRSAIRLKEDLDRLGQPVDTGEARIPARLSDTARAWGAMYVLEGSTLGGQVVRRMLLKQFPQAEPATTYFNGYGAATGAYWQRFKASLEDWHSRNGEAGDSIVEGARDTFVFFKKRLQAATLPS